MQDLIVALVQFDIQWHNPSANREIISKKIDSLEVSADLIVLPEMFTTGFTIKVESME